MTKTSLCREKSSCFSTLVLLARRHDLVALISDSGLWRVIYAAKFSLEEVTDLQKYDVHLLILRGKATKNKLTEAEREHLLQYIRESNASLN